MHTMTIDRRNRNTNHQHAASLSTWWHDVTVACYFEHTPNFVKNQRTFCKIIYNTTTNSQKNYYLCNKVDVNHFCKQKKSRTSPL